MLQKKQALFYQEADRLMVAVDCIIFGFDNRKLKLLLFKRKVEPFKNRWTLVGSFIKKEESVSEGAQRVLEEFTGLKDIYMELLGCYSDCDRDPGGRVISMAYYALIRLEEHAKQIVEPYQAQWFNVDAVPKLILDHNQMINNGLEKLRRKSRYQPIGFELLPKKFTLPQLQNLYEAIYQKPLDRRNFRKKILSMNILEKLEEKDKSTSKKGAFLYRFKKNTYKKLVAKGFNFEL